MQKPSPSAYVPFAKRYVDLVEEGDYLSLLEKNRQVVIEFFSSLPPGKDSYRYQPDKWTLKEMLLHIADAERVFAYRALTIARGDTDALFPNMDEQLFAANADPSARTMSDIIEEFAVVRDASVFLFKYLSERQLNSEAKLFGYPVTPLGFGYIIIGHSLHHINVARERYI
jgi:hypothetical protein